MERKYGSSDTLSSQSSSALASSDLSPAEKIRLKTFVSQLLTVENMDESLVKLISTCNPQQIIYVIRAIMFEVMESSYPADIKDAKKDQKQSTETPPLLSKLFMLFKHIAAPKRCVCDVLQKIAKSAINPFSLSAIMQQALAGYIIVAAQLQIISLLFFMILCWKPFSKPTLTQSHMRN